MAISDKLTYLNTTKTKIREGLNSLGADLDTEDTFRSYADAIDEIYEDYPKITGEGESLSLDNTKQASMKIDYKGNTSQNGTPTPSSPIPINVVSGDNTINICGKNLFNKTTANLGKGINTSNGNLYNDSSLFTTDFIEVKTGGVYYTANGYSTSANRVYGAQYDSNKQYVGSIAPNVDIKTFYISNASTKYIRLSGFTSDIDTYQLEVGSSATTYEPYIGNSYPLYLGVENLFKGYNDMISGFLPSSGSYPTTNSSFPDAKYMLIYLKAGQSITTDGSTSSNGRIRYIDKDTNLVVGGIGANETSYYKSSGDYQGSFASGTITAKKDFIIGILVLANSPTYSDFKITYGTHLQKISDTPIELCKIGTYQDYIYKDNGSWYLHKEIGKVVLNGSETTRYDTTNKTIIYEESNIRNYNAGGIVYCNYYLGTANGGAPNQNLNAWNGNSHNINIKNNDTSTLDDFKTWLSTHNTIVYYVLATPTNIPIEDTTLIEQLEELKLATSYESQTNISQDNNDLPFILDVKALRGE